MSNRISTILEILFSPYGKYMACAGLIVTCAGYDEYRMKQIGNIMAAKYSHKESIMIIANNKFMCPFTKIDIYNLSHNNITLTGKHNTLKKKRPLEKKYIATELCLTMPPLIELGNEVFICDADKCIKVGKPS